MTADGNTVYKSLLTATLNTRDLGGCPAGEGRRTVRNRFWRTDMPAEWNEEDEARLRQAGITDLIDLRTDGEAARKPCAYADREDFRYHRVPVSEGMDPPDSLEEVPVVYFRMALRPEMAEVFRTMAGAEGGVMFGCAAGKDRTGVISALLQLACGVERGRIVRDYALSREYNKVRMQQFLQEHPEIDPRVVLASETSMETFLDLFAERFGTVDGYFRWLGLPGDVIVRLRARLLEP